MKILAQTDLSREGNDCWINETIMLCEEFDAIYFTISIEKVVGWRDYRDVRIFNDAQYTKNYAIKKYKEYGGRYETVD